MGERVRVGTAALGGLMIGRTGRVSGKQQQD
jgi:hypothetical protein